MKLQLSEKEFTMNHAKSLWKQFIMDLLKTTVENDYGDESLNWPCGLTRFYRDYLLCMSDTTSSKCSDCTSFDAFIFSKISKSNKWLECNMFKNMKKIDECCLAWRRIMTFLDAKIYSSVYDKTKPKAYSTDVKTLMRWLSSKISMQDCEKKSIQLPKLPFNYYKPK